MSSKDDFNDWHDDPYSTDNRNSLPSAFKAGRHSSYELIKELMEHHKETLDDSIEVLNDIENCTWETRPNAIDYQKKVIEKTQLLIAKAQAFLEDKND